MSSEPTPGRPARTRRRLSAPRGTTVGRVSLRSAPPAAVRPSWRHDERGITPVVGTLLVLAITIIGMAAIMFWGAPTIERLRVSNTQSAMVGEFLDIRQSAAQLTIPDAARTPNINVPGGVLGFEPGTRFLISTMYNEASGIPSALISPDPDPTCDFHVTGWADSTPTTVSVPGFPGCGLTVAAGAVCGSQVCIRVYRVLGASVAEQTVTYSAGSVSLVAPAPGIEFGNSELTWLFRITSNAATPVTFGEAWLISSDLLYWKQHTASGEYESFFDSGAVFSGRGGALYIEERPLVQENMFGTGVFSFWLYAMDAFEVGEITATGTYQVFVGLLSLHPRVESLEVPFVRLDFHGRLAEAWCGGLVVRNNLLGFDGANEGYIEQPGFTCAAGDASGVRSLKYNDPDPRAEFPFQLVHATLRTSIQL